jgi:hypothetical protein
MLRIFGLATIAAAVALASPVAAKSKNKKAAQVTQAAREQVCRPLCNLDMTPCDPPEFKRVDGRCDFAVPSAGGFR